MPFIAQMQEAKTETEYRQRDPWHSRLQRHVRELEAISTSCALDIVQAGHTTGNARRLARIMRKLGFVPLRNRRLTPGGFRDTVCRGWQRPLLAAKK